MIMVDEQQRFWISFDFWVATSGRLGASSGPLRSVLGRLGSVLGGKTVLEPFWSRPGSVLEASWGRLGASWKRLGGVLWASWGFLGPSCGPFGASGGVLEASCA